MKLNVGFVGLGKLGLPCALAIEQKGHTVFGYDPSEQVQKIIQTKVLPYKEEGADKALAESKIEWLPLHEVAAKADIIFVPIQTPHNPRFEGVTRIPKDRADFDYSYLREGMKDLSHAIDRIGKDKVVVIISTVLPGTIEREIKPFLSKHIKLVYNPFFIAMGTTMHDFLNTEFVLMGVDDDMAAVMAQMFYATLHNRPVYRTTVKNAELIKVAYNTFIGMKIAYINTMMEVCHKIGADVDAVTKAMTLATDRLISGKYLTGGMGDGGGCHPRDNIAMSWLAKNLDLSYDFFESLMLAREKQTEWLADLIMEAAASMGPNTPIYVLGKAFKPETNLTVGSPATLLVNLLKEKGVNPFHYDPMVDVPEDLLDWNKGVWFIATKHAAFKDHYSFPDGSIVLDPFRYLPKSDKYQVVHIGGNP